MIDSSRPSRTYLSEFYVPRMKKATEMSVPTGRPLLLLTTVLTFSRLRGASQSDGSGVHPPSLSSTPWPHLSPSSRGAVLVTHGITTGGHRTLLRGLLCAPESRDSWKDLLLNLEGRRLRVRHLWSSTTSTPGLSRHRKPSGRTCRDILQAVAKARQEAASREIDLTVLDIYWEAA